MQRSLCQSLRPVAAQRQTPSRTHTTLVRAETRQTDGEKVARSKDSYEKIEEPVRKNWPEGSNIGSQNFAPSQSEADDFLKSPEANPDTRVLGTEVGVVDAMRFKGAAPEVINSRLAMVGFVLALLGEQLYNKNIIEQATSWPAAVAAVVLTITVATLVPITKGVPRTGNNVFSPTAELINGRLAMLGIAALFWNAWIS